MHALIQLDCRFQGQKVPYEIIKTNLAQPAWELQDSLPNLTHSLIVHEKIKIGVKLTTLSWGKGSI